MKISELNTNTFLNNSGSPENSYLLINYASAQGVAPATQQVSLDTLGKAVAAKLNLPIAVTDNQGNVTGLQHVVATGNQYQIENLNAQFGGGEGSGNSGGSGSSSVAIDPTVPQYIYDHRAEKFRAAWPVYAVSYSSDIDTLTSFSGTHCFIAPLVPLDDDVKTTIGSREDLPASIASIYGVDWAYYGSDFVFASSLPS